MFLELIMRKLKEPTTWRGIIALVAAAGVVISPALIESIIAAGLALVGLVEVIRAEKEK